MNAPIESERALTADHRAIEVGAPERGTVLLLHGFPDVPRAFAPVMARLACAGFRCVAPWMRGYAPSTLAGPFDLERLAADAITIADALGPPVHLVGHDWGAATAYAAAMSAPDRFATMTAISVPHPLAFLRALRSPAQLRRSWYMGFFQLPFLPERALQRGLVERLWRDWSPGFDPPPSHLAEVLATLRASMPAPIEYYRTNLRPSREALAGILELRGARITVPSLYLHGARDGCVGPEAARDQARWFESHRTEIIEGAGHFVPLERPDAVAGAILAHLR